jgi:hypothetical protein
LLLKYLPVNLSPVLQELLNAPSATAIDIEQVTAWQQQYPYYETAALAQALYAAAHKHTDAVPVYARAALITGNEPWLQVLLQKAAAPSSEKSLSASETILPEAPLPAEVTEKEPAVTEPLAAELPIEIEPETTEPSPVDAVVTETAESPVPETTAPVYAQAVETSIIENQPVIISEVPEEPIAALSVSTEADSEPVTVAAPGEIKEVHESLDDDGSALNAHLQEVVTVNFEVLPNTPGPINVENSSQLILDKKVEINDNQIITENIISSEAIAGDTPAAVETEALIPLEPYHTVDYFASQGIKHQAEEQPKDRLGRQLKSFTGWLKTLKKPGKTGTLETPISDVENEKVEKMARTSVENTQIDTETMADVLISQGRRQEAIAILEKLSLQDSGKSAYFAARIEHLKQN